MNAMYFPYGCGCACRTCPTCGGAGVIPAPWVLPVRPVWPRPRPRPILVEPLPLVPGFDSSRGAGRDIRRALA